MAFFLFMKITLTKNLILLVSLIAAALILIGLSVYFFIVSQQEVLPQADEILDEQAAQEILTCDFQRKIDGVCVFEGKENLPIYAFMIENAADSQPPANLAKANLVFEAIAEGGITRFVAMYDSDQEISRIGPVRSARTYFLDWASEVNSLYIHCGGSPESLELVKVRPVWDVNEFAYGSYFWRDQNRAAPHNVYTSFSSIDKLMENQQWSVEPDYLSWQYKDDLPLEQRPAEQKVFVDFNSYYYSIKWEYNQQENNYWRWQAGTWHKDEEATIIKAKNVVVMHTTSYVIAGDDKFRRYTKTVGQGQAVVFTDGQAIEGIWKRDSLETRTRFYNQDGQEIKLNRGTTWVQVLPDGYPQATY